MQSAFEQHSISNSPNAAKSINCNTRHKKPPLIKRQDTGIRSEDFVSQPTLNPNSSILLLLYRSVKETTNFLKGFKRERGSTNQESVEPLQIAQCISVIFVHATAV